MEISYQNQPFTSIYHSKPLHGLGTTIYATPHIYPSIHPTEPSPSHLPVLWGIASMLPATIMNPVAEPTCDTKRISCGNSKYQREWKVEKPMPKCHKTSILDAYYNHSQPIFWSLGMVYAIVSTTFQRFQLKQKSGFEQEVIWAVQWPTNIWAIQQNLKID